MNSVGRSYDLVAAEYHRRFAHELDHKPFDREKLAAFVRRLGDGAAVCEVGCGDGHVSAHLAELGANVRGVDVSAEMVAVARAAYPDLQFEQANKRTLPFEDAELRGIVAFYSIVNLDNAECHAAFREMFRVIASSGLVLLAFHIGDEKIHEENWWGLGAELDFFLHPVARIAEGLARSGFRILERATRPPYSADVEAQTERAYLLAERP